MNWLTRTPQFERGMSVEGWLDDYFSSRGFVIARTTPHQERVLCLGDRKFTRNGQSAFVEYKSGIQTFYTGNVFIETISVDTCNKPGWVYTSQANYLMYAALLNNKILVFRPERLRKLLPQLIGRFPVGRTDKQNKGYKTHGLLVPLAYAETYLSDRVIRLNDGDQSIKRLNVA